MHTNISLRTIEIGLLVIASIFLFGCSTILKDEQGELSVRPEVYEFVDAVSDTGSAAGIPYINYLGELFAVGCAIGLGVINKKRKREKLANEALVKAIEKSGNRVVKEKVKAEAKKNKTSTIIQDTIDRIL
jgi:hypothetical protein